MSEFNPDTLGRLVRHLWVDWARKQPNPKPSWLVPYDDLSEPDKQADREIGTGVAMIVAGKLHKAAEALMSETLEGFTQEVADQYRKTVDYEQRIAALEAERDVVRRAWEAAEARIAALVIERETLTRQVRSLTSDLEAECLDPDRKLHGIPGLVYTPDPDGCDPRMMRIDDPQTGAMGFGKGLWDAAYDLYDTMRDRLTASQAHAARLAAALGPFADGWAQYERVHGAQEARRGVVVSDGDTVGEFTRGQGRAAAAVLAATPADSLARQQAERAVVEAARALETHRQEAKRQLEHAETLEFPSGKPRWVVNVERERALMLALSKALAALDAGEGRDG